MKSNANSSNGKRKGMFPSLLSKAKGNPFSSRRIPAKQGQQGKLEPLPQKHPPLVPAAAAKKQPPPPVAKIKFTKATAQRNDDDTDRDSSKMSSLSDHDELFLNMRDSVQKPAPATFTVTTTTPQKVPITAKVQPAQEGVVSPAVVTAPAPDKTSMDAPAVNVNGANKDKKDQQSLPSSDSTIGSSQFSYGQAFQGDHNHNHHQPVTKTTGVVSKREVGHAVAVTSIPVFENRLIFDKQALQHPQQQQPQKQQGPKAVAAAVATAKHHHLHQPFVPPTFEKVMTMTKAETQEKSRDLDKGLKFATPPSPITLDQVGVQRTQEHSVASTMARVQPQPQVAPVTSVQESPKTSVSRLKDKSKTLLERSKAPVSLLASEKSKTPLSLLERSKSPGNHLAKSQTPFSLLERSKTSVSSKAHVESSKTPLSILKEKSQKPVSIEETVSIKTREQQKQPQQRGAKLSHLTIADSAVITEFMSALAVKGLPQDTSSGSNQTAPWTPQENEMARKIVASSESSLSAPRTPKENDLARKIALDKVRALLNRLNPAQTGTIDTNSELPIVTSDELPLPRETMVDHDATPRFNKILELAATNRSAADLGQDAVAANKRTSKPDVAATTSTTELPSIMATKSDLEQPPIVATASSVSTSSSGPHIIAAHSATLQQNVCAATSNVGQRSVAINYTVEPHIVAATGAASERDVVATTSALEQKSMDAPSRALADGLTVTTASDLDHHADGSAKDPTPRASDERTVDPFYFRQSPPKPSQRSAMEAPQDAPTSPSVSRLPVDAPEYFFSTTKLDPESEDIAAVVKVPKALASDERNVSTLEETDDAKAASIDDFYDSLGTTGKKDVPTTLTVDDEKALESLKKDFKAFCLVEEVNLVDSLENHESDGQSKDTQHRLPSDQIVINVEDDHTMTRQSIDDKRSMPTAKTINVDRLSVEENCARDEKKNATLGGDSESKESKAPTRLMLSVKTNPHDDSSDEDIPAPVVDAAAMMAALESTLPPRSAGNRKKSISPRKRGKSPRKSKKQPGVAKPPSPLTEANDMKETLRKKAGKKAEKHKSQHAQQKGVMTEAEAHFLARQAMENATKTKLDLRDPYPDNTSDLNVHPLKEVVFSADETVSDLDHSTQKFPVKDIVVEESSNVSLLDQSKKDLEVISNASGDEERDRYAPLISPGKDDSLLDENERPIDAAKTQSTRQALADSITEWSIEEFETEDASEVAVEVSLNPCNQIPLAQRLVQRWFGQKAAPVKSTVKGQSTAVKTNGTEKEEKAKSEDHQSDQLGKEYKVPPDRSRKSTVKLPDTTPIASNARKSAHFFSYDTSEQGSVNDELLEQGKSKKTKKLREPLGREPIPSLDQQSYIPVAPKEPDGRSQLLSQSGEDPSFAGSGERSSALMKEQEVQSCLEIYPVTSEIDRYHAIEETPTAKSWHDPREPPTTAKTSQLIPLGQIQEQERDIDFKSTSSAKTAGEQNGSLTKKIVEFGQNIICLSPSSQNDVKSAMRVLGPASQVLLERSIRKAKQGKKDDFTDSISQDFSRDSKHSIEVSIIEDNEEIEVGPLVTESAGDSSPSQDFLKRSTHEADENKKLDYLQDGCSRESKHTPDEDSVDERSLGPSEHATGKTMDEDHQNAALEALIKDVTEGLSLGSSKLESTSQNGAIGNPSDKPSYEDSIGGAILEQKDSLNDELFKMLKADTSHFKQESVKGFEESKWSEHDGHGATPTGEVASKTQQGRPAHSKLELIDLTGADSADDVDDGVWLFDLSPKNDLTDGFLQSSSDLDSLKEFATAGLGPDDNVQSASLEDVIEYASKLLQSSQSSNDDQDKTAVKSSLVVVPGIEVASAEITAIDSGITKLVEPTEIKAVDLDHNLDQADAMYTTNTKQATPDLIDLTDMASINSGEGIGLTVTKRVQEEPIDLTDTSLSDSRSKNTKSLGTQGTKAMDTEANVETNLKNTVILQSGKRLAEGTDCERSVKEGHAERKNDAGDFQEEIQVDVSEEKLKDEQNVSVKDCDKDEEEGLKIGASEDKTSQKSELQVDATEVREKETEKRQDEAHGNKVDRKNKVEISDSGTERVEKSSPKSVGSALPAAALDQNGSKQGLSLEPVDVNLALAGLDKKTSAVVTSQRRDILDFFFESTEMFLCGPSTHEAILRDYGENIVPDEDDDGSQGNLAPVSDSHSTKAEFSALLRSTVPFNRVPESQPCELIEESSDLSVRSVSTSCEKTSSALESQPSKQSAQTPDCTEESRVVDHSTVSSSNGIPVSSNRSAEDIKTGDVSTTDPLDVERVENIPTTPVNKVDSNLSFEDVDGKGGDDQGAEATTAGEIFDEHPDNRAQLKGITEAGSLSKNLFDSEDESLSKDDETTPSNSTGEALDKGLLDSQDGCGNDELASTEEDDSNRLEFDVSAALSHHEGSYTKTIPDAKQDASKRRKAPAPEDRLPPNFRPTTKQNILVPKKYGEDDSRSSIHNVSTSNAREEHKQKKAPAPEDRPSMELRVDDGGSGNLTFSVNDNQEDGGGLHDRVRNPIEASSTYASGSKAPSVVSERNTSRVSRISQAFPPKPEIPPTRRVQHSHAESMMQKHVRRAPTPETLSSEKSETRTSHKDGSDISEILGHFFGDATVGQIQSFTRGEEVIDVKSQSIEEKSEMQRSTRGEEVINVESQSIEEKSEWQRSARGEGDLTTSLTAEEHEVTASETAGQHSVAKESIAAHEAPFAWNSMGSQSSKEAAASREEDWYNSIPNSTCEEEIAGVDWSTIGAESGEEHEGIESAIDKEVASRTLVLANMSSRKTSDYAAESTSANSRDAAESNVDHASETMDSVSHQASNAFADALTSIGSHSSKENSTLRSSTSQEDGVEADGYPAVYENDVLGESPSQNVANCEVVKSSRSMPLAEEMDVNNALGLMSHASERDSGSFALETQQRAVATIAAAANLALTTRVSQSSNEEASIRSSTIEEEVEDIYSRYTVREAHGTTDWEGMEVVEIRCHSTASPSDAASDRPLKEADDDERATGSSTFSAAQKTEKNVTIARAGSNCSDTPQKAADKESSTALCRNEGPWIVLPCIGPYAENDQATNDGSRDTTEGGNDDESQGVGTKPFSLALGSVEIDQQANNDESRGIAESGTAGEFVTNENTLSHAFGSMDTQATEMHQQSTTESSQDATEDGTVDESPIAHEKRIVETRDLCWVPWPIKSPGNDSNQANFAEIVESTDPITEERVTSEPLGEKTWSTKAAATSDNRNGEPLGNDKEGQPGTLNVCWLPWGQRERKTSEKIEANSAGCTETENLMEHGSSKAECHPKANASWLPWSPKKSIMPEEVVLDSVDTAETAKVAEQKVMSGSAANKCDDEANTEGSATIIIAAVAAAGVAAGGNTQLMGTEADKEESIKSYSEDTSHAKESVSLDAHEIKGNAATKCIDWEGQADISPVTAATAEIANKLSEDASYTKETASSKAKSFKAKAKSSVSSEKSTTSVSSKAKSFASLKAKSISSAASAKRNSTASSKAKSKLSSSTASSKVKTTASSKANSTALSNLKTTAPLIGAAAEAAELTKDSSESNSRRRWSSSLSSRSQWRNQATEATKLRSRSSRPSSRNSSASIPQEIAITKEEKIYAYSTTVSTTSSKKDQLPNKSEVQRDTADPKNASSATELSPIAAIQTPLGDDRDAKNALAQRSDHTDEPEIQQSLNAKQESEVQTGESSTTASSTTSRRFPLPLEIIMQHDAVDPWIASSTTTASAIDGSEKYRDIKSTPASQEHFLAPIAIAAQRSKQEVHLELPQGRKQASSCTDSSSGEVDGASSHASTSKIVKQEGALNISRFGSRSGEEPLDAPPPRASASVSSRQYSAVSPSSGRREEAEFCRFGSINGDESLHGPPAHSFSSEAVMQNSLASPVSENYPDSPRGSTFFSRIEEGREEIESQSECTSSVDESSLLLALTRSDGEGQATSPTGAERVETVVPVQNDALRAASAFSAAAVEGGNVSRRGNAGKRSILERMRGKSLVSGTRSKASSQSLTGLSKKYSRAERERDTLDSSSMEGIGERSSSSVKNLGNISSTMSVPESVELKDSRKAFMRAPRLQTVLDRLRTRKGNGDSDSVSSSPVEIDELFTRYDSIVKHMVVFDDSRLQSQTPTVIDVTGISYQRNDGSTSTDGRSFPEITDLTDRRTPSPYPPISESSTTSSDDKGFEKETLNSEAHILGKSSSSDTATTTTPSQKARNLRQQLDQALHTSTMIRTTQERLGAELNTFKSRLEQKRRSGSPQRAGSPQRPMVSAPPTIESHSPVTISTMLEQVKAYTYEPYIDTTGIPPVPSPSASSQSDQVYSRSDRVEQNRSTVCSSPTFDQAASDFDRLKSERSQNGSPSPRTGDSDSDAIRKIAESAGKALLDEDNSSDDGDDNYADDDRIKKATVYTEAVDDEVQLQNLECIIENLRDAEERKRVVTSQRIDEAKRSVTGSSASHAASHAPMPSTPSTSSIAVTSIEFDKEYI